MLRAETPAVRQEAEFSLELKGVPLGESCWQAGFSEAGLAHFTILTRSTTAQFAALSARSEKRLKDLKKRLAARLRGEAADYAWDELDLAGRGKFHRSIWRAMHAIPFGKTQTYGEIAEAAGSPMAFRACGQACGANPIVIFIPCHRVVAASGIGGFASGLALKRTLLGLEKVEVS